MMNMTEEDWQTFAKKETAYVGFSTIDNYTIPLQDVPLYIDRDNEEKFCCLIIDKDHKWSFHFRKTSRWQYSLSSDKALLTFRGVLKERFNDDRWKPIDYFKYEFIFDGNDISFKREIESDIHIIQESYLRQTSRL